MTQGIVEGEQKTKVKFCTCQHEYQDRKYGKHMRLHNLGRGQTGTSQTWRCTVCGKKV